MQMFEKDSRCGLRISDFGDEWPVSIGAPRVHRHQDVNVGEKSTPQPKGSKL